MCVVKVKTHAHTHIYHVYPFIVFKHDMSRKYSEGERVIRCVDILTFSGSSRHSEMLGTRAGHSTPCHVCMTDASCQGLLPQQHLSSCTVCRCTSCISNRLALTLKLRYLLFSNFDKGHDLSALLLDFSSLSSFDQVKHP